MWKRTALLGVVLGALLCPPARAQKATEVFIPIGESPGVSGKTSMIGTIESVDRDGRTMTIRDPSGATHRVELTDETRIWLDRSEQVRTNLPGTMSDCKKGRRCEVKLVYVSGTRTARAEWVKIRPGG